MIQLQQSDDVMDSLQSSVQMLSGSFQIFLFFKKGFDSKKIFSENLFLLNFSKRIQMIKIYLVVCFKEILFICNFSEDDLKKTKKLPDFLRLNFFRPKSLLFRK